jgi:hypothetical protein
VKPDNELTTALDDVPAAASAAQEEDGGGFWSANNGGDTSVPRVRAALDTKFAHFSCPLAPDDQECGRNSTRSLRGVRGRRS